MPLFHSTQTSRCVPFCLSAVSPVLTVLNGCRTRATTCEITDGMC